MRIFNSIGSFVPGKPAVVTTGTFDGVHLGHRKIIDRLNQLANDIGGQSVLITFHPHPRQVLFPDDHGLSLLSPGNEKLELLEKAGIQNVIVHPFTKAFSRMSSLEYVRDCLVNKVGVKKLVIGYDHHFGRNREGTFDDLREYGTLYGFDVEEIPAQDVDHINVSSTKIRKALESGDIDTATSFLNYPYFIQGNVVEGRKLGRKLGYPTANLELDDPLKLVPANGIYAVRVEWEKKRFNGMLSIGNNPTIDDGLERSIEVHLFDMSENIYGEHLRVYFYKHLREEKKFDDLSALAGQIKQDELEARQFLQQYP